MNRSIRVGVLSHETHSLVVEAALERGNDVIVGAAPPATVCLQGWSEPPMLVVDGEDLLLRPGMRVNMCGPAGENRIVGTFEELFDGDGVRRIAIGNRRVNVCVNARFTLFIDAEFRR